VEGANGEAVLYIARRQERSMLCGDDFGKSEVCSSMERYFADVPKCAILSSDSSIGIANELEYEFVGCSADLVAVCGVSVDGGGEI